MTEQPTSPESSSPVRTEIEEPLPGLVHIGHVISPTASIRRTLTSGFSANRRATTDPDEPDPQMMKSHCDFISDEASTD